MIIITTVGTSLLNNLIKPKIKKSFRIELSSSDEKKISNGTLQKAKSTLDTAIDNFVQGNSEFESHDEYDLNLNASAEIKSICKIADGKPATVYLFATDTFMSEYAACQIKVHLHGKNGLIVHPAVKIDKLDIQKPEDFENAGFENLIGELENLQLDHKGDEIILNISGGYKALIPFMTIYGQLTKTKIRYIYENSNELLTIGHTPLDFDWTLADLYYEYLTNKELREKTSDDEHVIISMKNRGYLKSNKCLSALGVLLEKYVKKHLPQRQDVLGHYMEHKLFEAFFNNPYKLYRVNSIGSEYYIEKEDLSKFHTEKKGNCDRIEFDVELIDQNGKVLWFECKSFAQKGKAINQVEKFLAFNKIGLKKPIDEIGIFIYKYPFQTISGKIFSQLARKIKIEYGVTLTVLYWDIPFNTEKESITYKKIFETKLVLGENFHPLMII